MTKQLMMIWKSNRSDPDVGVDLDEPILLDIDGKTILDGFQSNLKRVGRDVIPRDYRRKLYRKKKGKSRPFSEKSRACCKGSVSSLAKKKYSGERGKMYGCQHERWQKKVVKYYTMKVYCPITMNFFKTHGVNV